MIAAISHLFSNELDFITYPHLAELPHFNVDLDTPEPPAQVAELRTQLKSADGVLICTPEYAMGIPGSLKNLLDWTVSSSDFSHKPVAAITASTSGEKAHESLLGTLRIMEARVDENTALLISHAKTKVNDKAEITDKNTLSEVTRVMQALTQHLNLKVEAAE